MSSWGRRPNLQLTAVVLVRYKNKITQNTASSRNLHEFWAKGWNIFSSLFYRCLVRHFPLLAAITSNSIWKKLGGQKRVTDMSSVCSQDLIFRDTTHLQFQQIHCRIKKLKGFWNIKKKKKKKNQPWWLKPLSMCAPAFYTPAKCSGGLWMFAPSMDCSTSS